MHRYHFHAIGPNRRIPDECGDYLDDMMVVRDLAFATIRDIASDPLGPADRRGWRVEVEDEDGRTVLVVPFRSALSVPVRSEPGRRARQA